MLDEDWGVVLSLLPENWRELAVESGAVKGLRKDKSAENLLRTLLIHLAGGWSLRETALRARQAGLAELSDVSVMKRLRKSGPWLQQMCRGLLAERGVELSSRRRDRMRLVDATTVKEPGRTGSLWRVHYSVEAPSLRCDYLKVTPSRGAGAGETLAHFPMRAGDCIVADAAYATAAGIEYACSRGAYVLLRMSPNNLAVYEGGGRRLPWRERLSGLTDPTEAGSWPVAVRGPQGAIVKGRVCALRKTEEAIRQTLRRLRDRARKSGHRLRDDTLFHCQYVILFSTFPQARFDDGELLHCYRLRWQIELVFKRFKQVARLGHLPKYDDDSSKAWLYGKLLVALLAEKLVAQARAFSPWGTKLVRQSPGEPMA
jgi:hypothetical protein